MHMKNQNASVTIGPVICKGLKPLPAFGSDCQSLKLLGQPPGFYVIKDENVRDGPYGPYIIAQCDENGDQIQNQTYTLFGKPSPRSTSPSSMYRPGQPN